MGLVNELQESAERDDVATVLRKAKRLSSKLGIKEINEWLDREQSGYPDGKSVPDYRSIPVSFCYNTNGPIPAGYGMVKTGIVPLHGINLNVRIPETGPISTVLSNIEALGEGRGVYVELDRDIAEQLRSLLTCNSERILRQVIFMAKLSETHIRDIPEQVKNRVLDWACKLEEAGVTGDGQSFTEKEKRIAEAVNFHIINSTVDQINNAGVNVKRGPNG